MSRALFHALFLLLLPATAHAAPETVYFKSADGAATIVGYLFHPAGPPPHPAVVMLHGRAGPYSSLDNATCTFVGPGIASPCNASTLTKRHVMWGEFWSARGYYALLPDSFGPRGKAHGFGRFTHDDPDRDSVNERTVRPLDAEGALAYLRNRGDVVGQHVFLQGWSNGASTTLNVMIRQAKSPGFRAALAFYPGCGLLALLDDKVRSPMPILLQMGEADEEVNPEFCAHVAQRSQAAGTPIEAIFYPGASHDFDDPGDRRQDNPANAAAKAAAMAKAAQMIDGYARQP